MTDTLDRMDPEQFEQDDEGYWQASEEAGPDGKAKGIAFSFWVQPPEEQLKHYYPATLPDWDGFTFTDDEIASWPCWFAEQYPDIDVIDDGGDLLAFEVYGEFKDGEDNTALYFRTAREHPSVDKIRNRWCIYYHGLLDYIVHCKTQREEAA